MKWLRKLFGCELMSLDLEFCYIFFIIWVFYYLIKLKCILI